MKYQKIPRNLISNWFVDKLNINLNVDKLEDLCCRIDNQAKINITDCCKTLKSKKTLTFEDWYMFMDYQKDTYTTYIDKQGVSYFENELKEKYNCYLKHTL